MNDFTFYIEVSNYLFTTKKERVTIEKLLQKTKVTYLRTLHPKIQRGRDDIIQVWIDFIIIMAPWEIQRTMVDQTHSNKCNQQAKVMLDRLANNK